MSKRKSWARQLIKAGANLNSRILYVPIEFILRNNLDKTPEVVVIAIDDVLIIVPKGKELDEIKIKKIEEALK